MRMWRLDVKKVYAHGVRRVCKADCSSKLRKGTVEGGFAIAPCVVL